MTNDRKAGYRWNGNDGHRCRRRCIPTATSMATGLIHSFTRLKCQHSMAHGSTTWTRASTIRDTTPKNADDDQRPHSACTSAVNAWRSYVRRLYQVIMKAIPLDVRKPSAASSPRVEAAAAQTTHTTSAT
ncbi:hypothetical protein DYB34_013532 [Aphanomyces astaci]|uniref:Uncharacterized protein n=1 Tax=Aphanomyces astaci TaxID=112090 RepID=A0A418C8G7_APHAT|nr:hypothetical protein DYB34_013532 [Aphanomyces astaci]